MKVSIVTAVLNNKKYISEAIESVVNQDYKQLEHIIIDGGSTDGTLEVIKKYKNKQTKLITEKDKGLYDAMNKGIKLATGDIVGILNSDDIFFNNKVVSKVVDVFKNKNVDSIYSDLLYVDSNNTNKIIRRWISSQYSHGAFKKGWHPPHPTFYVKREIYEKYGYIDDSFNVSADFELMLRFLEKYRISTFYIHEPFVKMRIGGVSNRNLFNILKGNINCYRAFKKNKIKVSIFYIFYRLLPKLKQFTS